MSMAEGLAKSSPSNTPMVIQKPSPTDHYNAFEYDGVPIDFYQFFGVPMDKATIKDKKELSDMYSWGKENNKSLGDMMQSLRDLELKLGQPPIGMRRQSKLWNHMKLQRNINDLVKRQDALNNRRSY